MRMVDIGQQPGVEAASLSLAVPRRVRDWYHFWLAIYLLGPAIVSLGVMGWLKAP
jgi:hypothetical protein